MQTSENTDAIVSSLIAVQSQLDNPERDATASGGKFEYDYTTLDNLVDLVEPVLNESGIFMSQTNDLNDGKAVLVTTLMHTSGQFIRSETLMMIPERDPQEFGSAMTYARRYALSSILGLASETDDDANRTSSSGSSSSSSSDSSKDWEADPITDGQKNEIFRAAGDLGDKDEIVEYYKSQYSVDSLSDLRKGDASSIIEHLHSKIDEDGDSDNSSPPNDVPQDDIPF